MSARRAVFIVLTAHKPHAVTAVCVRYGRDNETKPRGMSAVCVRYGRDDETKPRAMELSIIISQDCNHAPTGDVIRTFYRYNITHIQVWRLLYCSGGSSYGWTRWPPPSPIDQNLGLVMAAWSSVPQTWGQVLFKSSFFATFFVWKWTKNFQL